MKSFFRAFLLLGLIGFIVSQCVPQPETIVIDNSPESPDTTATQDTAIATESANFKQLIIGEMHPITTLDPLFADNNSARRTLQVLYEGLVRYNEHDEIVPAIAKRWRVAEDSLSYGFILRNNIFYHDSDIFSNGLGRKVVASDVKYAFERMARNTVPPEAAQLFMAIQGFEPFFNEQHNVLNPAYREVGGVNGIQVPNDTTVIFQLEEKDPHFLQKMASPYASIYPREAVRDNPTNFVPVGSGPFTYSQQVGDSLYVFSRNQDYRSPQSTAPVLDRVDVMVEQNESQLLKALAGGSIHLIPEVGPQVLSNILADDTTALSTAYAPDYHFQNPGGRTIYHMRYNPQSGVPRDVIHSLFSGINTEALKGDLPDDLITVTNLADSVEADTSAIPSTILSAYSEDPYQRWFLQRISNQWMEQPNLQMLRIRTPSRHTALYTTAMTPFYKGQSKPEESDMMIQYEVQQSVLSIQNIEQLHLNNFSWWIDLRQVDMPGIDQL